MFRTLLSRSIMCVLLLLLSVGSLMAQTVGGKFVGEERAEHTFMLLRTGQADSLIASMSKEMQAALGDVSALRGLWSQVESQTGSYQSHEPWEYQRRDSLDVYTSLVVCEQIALKAVIVFNDREQLCGMQFMPDVSRVEKPAIALPANAVELPDTLHAGNFSLPCTVTLSGGSAAPPIVVMVHGSGPLDRDETVLANKPFRDLACQLAERGVSTLRYDKRTFVSQQPVASMDEETIEDALEAIRLAHNYSNRVFLLGHSLGAMLAPVIAQRAEGQLSGIVMMAAPARDLPMLLREQTDYLMPDATDSVKQQSMEMVFQQCPYYREPQGQVEAALQLNLPMLLMQGGRDYQVSLTSDFALWQQQLEGRDGVVLKSYPSLNHLFLAGEGTSQPMEYAVPGRIPHEVVDDIMTFINP